MVTFAIGLLIGCFLGVILAALMVSASDSDPDNRRGDNDGK